MLFFALIWLTVIFLHNTERLQITTLVLYQRTLTIGELGSITGLQIYKVWFNCFITYIQIATYFLCWSMPLLLNWRPAVQWSFSPMCECSLVVLTSEDNSNAPSIHTNWWASNDSIVFVFRTVKIFISFDFLDPQRIWFGKKRKYL